MNSDAVMKDRNEQEMANVASDSSFDRSKGYSAFANQEEILPKSCSAENAMKGDSNGSRDIRKQCKASSHVETLSKLDKKRKAAITQTDLFLSERLERLTEAISGTTRRSNSMLFDSGPLLKHFSWKSLETSSDVRRTNEESETNSTDINKRMIVSPLILKTLLDDETMMTSNKSFPQSILDAAESQYSQGSGENCVNSSGTSMMRVEPYLGLGDSGMLQNSTQGDEGNSSPPTPEKCAFFFPKKLHNMLTQLENSCEEHNGMKEDVVGWKSDGGGFVIRKPDVFASDVLPLFFPKCSKLASFQRQLTLYGFERDSRRIHRSQACSYRHEFFVRGKPELCRRITRLRKPTIGPATSNDKKNTTKAGHAMTTSSPIVMMEPKESSVENTRNNDSMMKSNSRMDSSQHEGVGHTAVAAIQKSEQQKPSPPSPLPPPPIRRRQRQTARSSRRTTSQPPMASALTLMKSSSLMIDSHNNKECDVHLFLTDGMANLTEARSTTIASSSCPSCMRKVDHHDSPALLDCNNDDRNRHPDMVDNVPNDNSGRRHHQYHDPINKGTTEEGRKLQQGKDALSILASVASLYSETG